MRKIVKDRHDHILEYCRGETVLHLGCIGAGYRSTSPYQPWLHKEICDVAKECVGIDIDQGRIKEAEKRCGSRIVYGDVSAFDLGRKFDVIVAGDIIEHLDNFRSFFDSNKKHMRDNSLLIITTANPFGLSNIVRVVLFGRPTEDPDHVVYFDLFTLTQMLRMNGMRVKAHYYGTEVAVQRVRNIIVRGLGRIWPIYNFNFMVVAEKRKKGDE